LGGCLTGALRRQVQGRGGDGGLSKRGCDEAGEACYPAGGFPTARGRCRVLWAGGGGGSIFAAAESDSTEDVSLRWWMRWFIFSFLALCAGAAPGTKIIHRQSLLGPRRCAQRLLEGRSEARKGLVG